MTRKLICASGTALALLLAILCGGCDSAWPVWAAFGAALLFARMGGLIGEGA